MPNINIQKEFSELNVDGKIKKNINALESFMEKNKFTKISELLAPTFELSQHFSETKKQLGSLNTLSTIANGIFYKDLDQLLSDIKGKIKEIRDNYPSLKNENSIGKLDAVKNSLEKEIKKPLKERDESVISKAENELKLQTILVLKEQLKKNKDFKSAIEFYNSKSSNLLCIARYIWLSEQLLQNSDYAETIENLIKEKINAQATADITGSSLPVSGNITLFDLARIKDWNNFKFNFGKELKKLHSKKNEAVASIAKTSETNEENLNLHKEISKLKIKITSLETELSVAYSNLEENKTILAPNKSADSNSEEFDSFKEQNDNIITDLNKQLFAATENNEQLTAEIDTHKQLNEKQKQTIESLSDELGKLKTELAVKEKQVAENLNDLEQKKSEILSTTNKLQKKEQALEGSQKKHEELSNNLTKLSNELSKKKQSLDETENTLNNLKIEHNQIQLLKNELESKLEQTELYNTELLKLKEEETTKLRDELKKLNIELAIQKSALDTNSSINLKKVLCLEATIKEKNASLEQLNNELKNLQESEKAFREAAEELKIKLAEKSKQLTDRDEQLQKLNNQLSQVSIRTEELEKNYQTQLNEYNALKINYKSDTQKLEEALVTFNEKTKLSENEASDLKLKVHSLETNLKEEKNNLSQTTEEIVKLRTDYSALQTQFITTEQVLTTKLKKAEEEKDTLNEELAEITAVDSLFIDRATKALINISPPNNYLSHSAQESVKEKKLEEIFQKIAFLNIQVQEKENAIQELQNDVATLKTELDKKDVQTSIPQEQSNIFLDHSLAELSALTETLKKPNLEIIPKKFDISQDFDDLEDNIDDDYGFKRNNFESDLNAEFNPHTLLAKRLESTEKLLANKQAELIQKINEIEQLQNQLLAKETEVKNLNTKAQQEADDLASQVKETQERLKKSQDHIVSLKTEQINKDAANQEKLAIQIEELDKLKTHYEKSIQELGSQITDKEAHLEDLSSMLNASHQQVQQLKRTINSIETEKETLGNKLEQLEQKNKKELQELQNKLKNLEVNFEISKKDYSSLKTNYDNLKEEFKEKTQDLNLIKADLESSKTETIDARQQNGLYSLKKEERSMKDGEVNHQLNKPINQNVFNPFQDPFKVEPSIDHSDSSSGRGSINSSSSDLTEDENLNHSSSRQENIPQVSSDEAFSDSSSSGLQPGKLQFSDEESLEVSEEEDKLTKNTASRPSILNADTCIPTSNQQDKDREATLEEIKQGVNAAFKQENHPAIIDAFINKFLQIATDTANKLFKGNVNHALHRFEPKLKKIASDQITGSIFPYINNSPDFKARFSEKIHTNKLIASDYLEKVINSTELIFDNLTIENPAQNYKDNISDQGKNLLIKLCIKNLQTNEKESLLELAKNNLVKQASENDLKGDEYAEIIQRAAEELRTKLLETENLQKTLEEIIKNPIVDLNLLAASKQKLQDQVVQEICDNFVNYFPNLHLDPILEKINNGKTLSNEEIAKLPSELQYANTVEEFVSGLRVEYPNLSLNYVNKINEDAFKQLRLTLRKNALSAISRTLSDDDISDLNAKAWLENQLQLITGKAINLEQIELEKKQKKLLNELDSALQPSSFYDIALTPKSIAALKAEIKEFTKAQLAVAKETNKLFAEIENQQILYPSLIANDSNETTSKKYSDLVANENAIKGFRGNLNQYLDNLSLKEWQIADEETKILLTAINQRLKKDISRWSLFDNKLHQEITDSILNIADENSFKFGNDVIKKRKIVQELVAHALTILRKNYSNNTFEKRELWLKNMALLYTATQNLQACSSEIANRKVKIENLLELKEKKDHEVRTSTGNSSANYQGIFLPHNCIVITDTCDPNLEKPIESEFTMLANNFYSKDAMKTGQTITFEQKLNNGKNREWSVTKNATSLTYNTSSWVDRLKNVGDRIRNKLDPFNSSQLSAEDKEVIFAAFSHAIASSKGSVLTLSIGANCSREKEIYIRLLIEDFNKHQKINGSKISILIHNNDKLKIHKTTKIAIKNEIYTKNLPSKELVNVVSKSKETTQNIIKPRGL